MNVAIHLLIACILAMFSSFLLTYPIKRLAIRLAILDLPNDRKIHTEAIPRLGGLSIFIGACLGAIYLKPRHEHLTGIVLGAIIILITGILDDKYHLRPMAKLMGQFLATVILIYSGLLIDRITIPVMGIVELGMISVPLTIIWIIGITNAMNLIDGLDGLAAGVSIIALFSMFIMAIIDMQVVAAYLCIVLIGSNLGFLYHNFYPAKIYMGDSGSNFLGYMIATISILGLFKNITFFSFIVPVIILALPIFDTILAIIRRITKKESVMKADNKHIHYRLIENGYSHPKAVLMIYTFSALFGVIAILLSKATLAVSLLITILVLILLHIFAELAGLFRDGKRPLLNILMKPLQKK